MEELRLHCSLFLFPSVIIGGRPDGNPITPLDGNGQTNIDNVNASLHETCVQRRHRAGRLSRAPAKREERSANVGVDTSRPCLT